MRDKIENGASNGERRATCSNAVFRDRPSAFLCNQLYVGLEAQLVAGTRHEVLGTCCNTGLEVGRIVQKIARGSANFLVLLQECLESLESPANLLLADIGHLEDLPEASLLPVVAAGNEDTASDDGILRFAFEELRVIRDSEQELCRLCGGLRDVLRVAQRCDLAVGGL